ncbi:GT4_PimA-like domain containing protein [Methylophilaceae bacterium]
MKAVFVTPSFTLKPLSGFENAVLRDYANVSSLYKSVVVVCSSCRDIDDSVSIIILKNRWLDSLKLFLISPFSLIVRLKNARLCLFVRKNIINSNYTFIHLNQPWLYYGRLCKLNSLLQVRFHNDDVRYLRVLAFLEKSILKKILLFIESLKVIYLLFRIDSIKSQLVCYTNNDVAGLKKYLRLEANIIVMAFPAKLLKLVQYPNPTSRIVFFGSDNRPNRESLEWFERNFCPSFKESIDFYSSSESIQEHFKDSKWIKQKGYSADIIALYSASPIFVFPVFSGSGIKMKVVDALETGSFVITTTEGAAGISALQKNLIILEDFSVKTLSHTIKSLRNRVHENE